MTKIKLFTDSKLMARHIGGLYQAKNNKMSAYLGIVKHNAKQFKSTTIVLKLRLDVMHTNILAYLVAALEDDLPRHISICN